VFEAPFFVMERIDGSPVRSDVPAAWSTAPTTHPVAVEELVYAHVEIHAVDWEACGLGDLAHDGAFLPRQVERWLRQLTSYEGRDLPAAQQIGTWLDDHRPAEQPASLCHGDYKLDNVLFAPDPPPELLVVVDWEMASIGDPLVDLAWSLIFHPGPEGDISLGVAREPALVVDDLPTPAQLVERYALRSGRDTSGIRWYDVFARWKLAIVLEGSYAKFQKGRSDNPLHEFFGAQTDLLLDRAATIIDDGRGS
jgi:aminoglycoside phosphotransferase (APT) family kinase protein